MVAICVLTKISTHLEIKYVEQGKTLNAIGFFCSKSNHEDEIFVSYITCCACNIRHMSDKKRDDKDTCITLRHSACLACTLITKSNSRTS